MWLIEKSFLEGVPDWWQEISCEGWMGFYLFKKLKELWKKINDWKKEMFGSVEEKKGQLLCYIASLDLKEETCYLTETERYQRLVLKEEFQRKVHWEEIKWNQRSRVRWLVDGDRNTKFFQGISSARQCVNCISSYQGGNYVLESKEDIEAEIIRLSNLLGKMG